jgi:glutathione S-transferase
MSTPPRVTPDQLLAACSAIVQRHLRAGDEEISSAGSDPSDLLLYLRMHGGRVPEGVRVDDLFDAVVLHLHLWWKHQERERWLILSAEKLQVHHGQIAAAFGMGSGQGFRDRRDRLNELLSETGSGRPDEQAARAARADASRPGSLGEGRWLAAAKPTIMGMARAALTFWLDVDEEAAEELLELRRDVKAEQCTVQTFTFLQGAVRALSACQAPKVLARAAQVQALVGGLERLEQDRARAVGSPA